VSTRGGLPLLGSRAGRITPHRNVALTGWEELVTVLRRSCDGRACRDRDVRVRGSKPARSLPRAPFLTAVCASFFAAPVGLDRRPSRPASQRRRAGVPAPADPPHSEPIVRSAAFRGPRRLSIYPLRISAAGRGPFCTAVSCELDQLVRAFVRGRLYRQLSLATRTPVPALSWTVEPSFCCLWCSDRCTFA
jgi:hypothetical protein